MLVHGEVTLATPPTVPGNNFFKSEHREERFQCFMQRSWKGGRQLEDGDRLVLTRTDPLKAVVGRDRVAPAILQPQLPGPQVRLDSLDISSHSPLTNEPGRY